MQSDGVLAKAADVVAAIIPEPVTPSDAPVPTSIAAVVFVALVIALKAVAAVAEEVNVRVVTPPTIDGVMVIFVPATKLAVVSCVTGVPPTWKVW